MVRLRYNCQPDLEIHTQEKHISLTMNKIYQNMAAGVA